MSPELSTRQDGMMIARLLACFSMLVPVGQVSRVIDGDTFILYSVGVPAEERVRVLGVDAVELRTPQGPTARAFTVAWLAKGPFKLETCKRDDFGRLLAVVTRGADTIARALIVAGLGVPR